jgi:hypothetical protein
MFSYDVRSRLTSHPASGQSVKVRICNAAQTGGGL